MANESAGLIGRKLGMTQIYDAEDNAVPVTVIDIGTNTVVAHKTPDPDGYTAVQLGVGEQKPSRTTQPMKGHFDKAGVSPQKHLAEIRLPEGDLDKYPLGQDVGPDAIFEADENVDVTGVSKGRGFSGVMKRHNFRGFMRTHGTHEYFRHGGSIGTRLTPGHVLKGKKMPGHMGSEQVTVQNLRLVRIDAERGLLFVKGGVPGRNGGLVTVRKAVKIRRQKKGR